MKKYANYIIVFLLIVSGYFIYNSYKLVKNNELQKKEYNDLNELFEANTQYNIQLEDSISRLHRQMIEGDKLSLKGNQQAQAYFEKFFPEIQTDWNAYILQTLMKTNRKNADNPLVPYEGMDGHMKIDYAKVLNNRWIIAHFTDATYSGEMIVRYDVNKDNTIDFKVLDQTLFGN